MRSIDLEQIRTRLAGKTGRLYWRSLEELADSEEFREMLHREFPVGACDPDDSLSRRNFLKLMGASLALAGATGGCWKQPEEKIVPYVEQPELIVPGRPLYFATACPISGYGIGVLAESHMGRPTKIEGNPDHAASLGGTNTYMQASVLGLYDPDRSQTANRAATTVSTWERFLAGMTPELNRMKQTGGAAFRLLTGTVTSPTLIGQIEQLLAAFPMARWHRFDPVGRMNTTQGARLAFGQPVDSVYHFDRADVVVSFESDFLFDLPGSVRYARDFAQRRRILRSSDPGTHTGDVRLNKLFVAEACPTITGAMADNRLPVQSSRIEQLVLALVAAFGRTEGGIEPPNLLPPERKWVRSIIEAIGGARGTSLFVAGESQPPFVHALVHAFNAALGNVGSTVSYIAPVAPPPSHQETLEALAGDIDAGEVDTLVMIDVNPAYTAPANLNFAQKLLKPRLRVHMGLYNDETAFLCNWHIPMSHYLETWGDIRAYDGTASIIQPLIQPLYASRTPHELIAALLGQRERSAYEIVRAYWQARTPGDGFEQTWRTWLHHGTILGESIPQITPTIDQQAIGAAMQTATPTTAPSTQPSAKPMEIVFRPDPSVWDGSYANNGALQELPKPITKLTWDNAAYLSPATARRMSLSREDMIRLRYRGRELTMPVLIVPGHADDCISITLGYGRDSRSLRIASGNGFNAYSLRTSDAAWFGAGLEIARTGDKYALATTQSHFNMEGRDLARTISPDAVGHPPAAHGSHHGPRHLPLSMFPDSQPSDPPYQGQQWGMSIDLSSCIGCNACVVACQTENNIPIVGKEGVQRSREMHWLRIDTYFSAPAETDVWELENPQTLFQPVLCMHCEKAPCEVVCPVAATTHSDEGLNEMTYNRCIGTRYCSNNCPYKVRRFNFFEYNPMDGPAIMRMVQNPDVTVRSRGVMEKCTYCVQRINQARIEAQKQDRRIYDGEVVTACQQACPTQAIVFGDINDPKSLVYEMKFREPFSNQNYALLNEELGTRPRTTYLPRIVTT